MKVQRRNAYDRKKELMHIPSTGSEYASSQLLENKTKIYDTFVPYSLPAATKFWAKWNGIA